MLKRRASDLSEFGPALASGAHSFSANSLSEQD